MEKHLYGDEDLHQIIKGCLKKDRNSQKILYKAMHGYVIGICLRYSASRHEAVELLNSGFFKALNNIDRYDNSEPFKTWLGRIMMNTVIDQYRSNLKVAYADDPDADEYLTTGELSIAKLNYDELLMIVQGLPIVYRTVFNLFAIDGYNHHEIADMLGINIAVSKLNLHKARQKIQRKIAEQEKLKISKQLCR